MARRFQRVAQCPGTDIDAKHQLYLGAVRHFRAMAQVMQQLAAVSSFACFQPDAFLSQRIEGMRQGQPFTSPFVRQARVTANLAKNGTGVAAV